ncbi:OLC1v1032081C1 [Oldenlandia corymbosa var. corymbosa]|uniref:OLC1v1032081C1 n=1 Tax=Oldenlandia corymbosa var. corymbosa TaxID=529605 RepID=A0AAV1CKT2_OLDCO|nr:OLC1v1032081C1 [Oldenlandia corymbosa var. corymbosa]
MLLQKKKSQAAAAAAAKGNRLLISITVLGSAGPIRFVVSEGELVAAVIDTALKSYAREGRLPVLGTNLDNFVLYCPCASTEALSPWETIGSLGFRNFMLCKKPQEQKTDDAGKPVAPITRKSSGSGIWKSWFHKSHNNLKVPSH